MTSTTFTCIRCGRPCTTVEHTPAGDFTVCIPACDVRPAPIVMPCPPYHATPHPESCKCRGTGCRYVHEVMIDEPCEEEQHDEDPHPDVIARQELRDWERGR